VIRPAEPVLIATSILVDTSSRVSLKNYQHSLDSYYIVCSFAGGRIAARCGVQIGRTRSDPAPGFDSARGDSADGNGLGCACRRGACIYFCQLIPRISLLVFVLVSATIEDEN
jgi:hypothetical protein